MNAGQGSQLQTRKKMLSHTL